MVSKDKEDNLLLEVFFILPSLLSRLSLFSHSQVSSAQKLLVLKRQFKNPK